jgi:curved DNA-binding protein
VLTVHVTPHAQFRRDGDDLHLDLPITIAEAYHGAKVPVPTPDASVNLKVPAGAQSGQVVRLRGKGVARKGRAAGDLYVHFVVMMPEARNDEVAGLVDKIAEYQKDDPRRDIRL